MQINELLDENYNELKVKNDLELIPEKIDGGIEFYYNFLVAGNIKYGTFELLNKDKKDLEVKIVTNKAFYKPISKVFGDYEFYYFGIPSDEELVSININGTKVGKEYASNFNKIYEGIDFSDDGNTITSGGSN